MRFSNSQGDSAYYKRTHCKEWHGPVKVPGQDGHQLVKNGSNYIRVHPCRLQLVHEICESPKETTTNQCNPNTNREHFAQTLKTTRPNITQTQKRLAKTSTLPSVPYVMFCAIWYRCAI